MGDQFDAATPPAGWRALRRTPSHDNEHKKTFIVLGCGRGGTSMTAGILRVLGVDMGERLTNTHEDLRFKLSLQLSIDPRIWLQNRLCWRRLKELVAERDREADLWGFKSVTAHTYIGRLAPLLRNPYYILVMRNPLDVAFSSERRKGRPWQEMLRLRLRIYRILARFVRRAERPAFVFSYDWALREPASFVDALAAFTGLAPSAMARTRAIGFINRDRGYQQVRPVDGYIDEATPRFVRGWILTMGHPGPLAIELVVDGAVVGETIADKPRLDVRRAGLHATGKCGFEFGLPPEKALAVGSEINVRVPEFDASLPAAVVIDRPGADAANHAST